VSFGQLDCLEKVEPLYKTVFYVFATVDASVRQATYREFVFCSFIFWVCVCEDEIYEEKKFQLSPVFLAEPMSVANLAKFQAVLTLQSTKAFALQTVGLL